ncbi:KDGP aldolase, partial [Salmonella enterica subsp. enterica serovar Montevideo]|nr:KDGP aldolase [Salmonella enterica subsp. enterica serovar Montevideo]
LEPTGGIDLENFAEILHIALDAGVSKIIPHIYSSIIDKVSGNNRGSCLASRVRQRKLLAIFGTLPIYSQGQYIISTQNNLRLLPP